MNLVQPKWQLYDNYGNPTDWASINAACARWYSMRDASVRRLRQDKQVARGIVLTEAGRAWLMEHRG